VGQARSQSTLVRRPHEWQKSDHKLDFRVGGREHVSGGEPGKPPHVFDAIYQDIVPNVRIIYGYGCTSVTSGSRSCLPQSSQGRRKGTRLVFTGKAPSLTISTIQSSASGGTIDLL